MRYAGATNARTPTTSTSRFVSSRAARLRWHKPADHCWVIQWRFKRYQCIAEKFAREGGFGPVTVREFMTESASLGDMTTDQVELDAFRQVRAWLDYLGL